jgi:predicted nucleotidyltransferase
MSIAGQAHVSEDDVPQFRPDQKGDMSQDYGTLVESLKTLFGDRLKTVVLFGSRARGDASPRRDHDLFIVIEDLPSDPVLRARMVRSALLETPFRANLVAKTPQEMDANLSPLLLDVCVDGICLFGEKYFERYRQRALKALEESGLERKRVGRELVWRFRHMVEKEWELTWEGFRELR